VIGRAAQVVDRLGEAPVGQVSREPAPPEHYGRLDVDEVGRRDALVTVRGVVRAGE
jgi:hypothetical protein